MQEIQEVVPTSLRTAAGGLVPTAILNEMLKMANQTGKDAWINLPPHQWVIRTGASRTEFESGIRLLLAKGLIEELTNGQPATRKFRIHAKRLQQALLGVSYER